MGLCLDHRWTSIGSGIRWPEWVEDESGFIFFKGSSDFAEFLRVSSLITPLGPIQSWETCTGTSTFSSRNVKQVSVRDLPVKCWPAGDWMILTVSRATIWRKKIKVINMYYKYWFYRYWLLQKQLRCRVIVKIIIHLWKTLIPIIILDHIWAA